MSRLAHAQHEAAHVVVGVACGLRLVEASIKRARDADGRLEYGRTWFRGGERRYREAWALAYAAGIAWELAAGDVAHADGDRLALRGMRVQRASIEALTRAAGAMLRDLASPHALVTRALIDRDRLTAIDLERLARGERLDDET